MNKPLPGGRANWILAALLAASLIWAYWAGHNPRSRSGGGDQPFALWELEAQDISRITVQAARKRLILEPEVEPKALGPLVWLRSESAPPPTESKPSVEAPADLAAADNAAASANAGTGAPAEPPAAASESAAGAIPPAPSFKGNRSAEQSFGSLATLLVQRRLGKLSDIENPLQYGLPAELEYVEVERRRGPPLRLNLGGSTFGDTYRYAHYTADDSVYLVKQSTVQGLTRTPTRMMDRDLFPFPASSATRLDLRSEGAEATYFRLTASAADQPEWGESADAENGVDAVQTFMVELAKLKALDYLGAEAAPASAAPALEATLTAEGREPVTLKFLEEQGDAWTALSGHTRRPVRLNKKLAGTVLDAARPLLEGK